MLFYSCLVSSELAPPVDQNTEVIPEASLDIGAGAPSQSPTTFAHRKTDETPTTSPSPPHIDRGTDGFELDLNNLENVRQSSLEDNPETEAPVTPRHNSVDEDAIGAALMSQLSLLDAVSTNSGING